MHAVCGNLQSIALGLCGRVGNAQLRVNVESCGGCSVLDDVTRAMIGSSSSVVDCPRYCFDVIVYLWYVIDCSVCSDGQSDVQLFAVSMRPRFEDCICRGRYARDKQQGAEQEFRRHCQPGELKRAAR